MEEHEIFPLPPCNSKQPDIINTLLYNGSKFKGHQRSKGNYYDVEVTLQHVDLDNSYVCGYLKISGLTEEFPTMTTFFDGEIISERYPFLTRKWDADEEVDIRHWKKFLSFYQFSKTFNSSGFDYANLRNSDYVFMRWKEHFLVPNHKIENIHGASFAGFYYICFQKSTATIEGYYYYRTSEMFQSLNLRHSPESTISVYQFR
uniref:Glucose-induced degradation protein 4 homolog n=1 Tax=Phallusia mammillata TaxID=59560 RepID=A0A6F9DEC0_9ASCI|nr:glucose-induced degradation protein 4 homolog [Phallusia mammillata]